jgi:CheY-specific phosphatase CheX
MPETPVEQALQRAAGDVLEKMFFAGYLEDSAQDGVDEPSIAVQMSFDGERKGSLGLRISAGAARTLAADFLGIEAEEGPEEQQVQEVVCELANMICGDALSALEKSPLRLSAPRIVAPADFALPAQGTYRSFDLGNGGLTVTLSLQEEAAHV